MLNKVHPMHLRKQGEDRKIESFDVDYPFGEIIKQLKPLWPQQMPELINDAKNPSGPDAVLVRVATNASSSSLVVNDALRASFSITLSRTHASQAETSIFVPPCSSEANNS